MFPSPNLSALRWATLRWLPGLILALLAGGPGLALGQSGIPNIINYQGKLTDNLGNPVKAGGYQVTFKIWDSLTSPNDPNYIWGSSFPVHVVTNGMFNVLLTDGVKIGNPKTNLILQAFEGDQRFLGLTITRTPDGDVPQTEISPRQRLVSAPFAIHTYNASFAGVASNSITASNAAFASYAYYATNAGKFSGFTTNDFLLVNKTAQTLTGSLTISNGTLTVNGNVTGNGTLTVNSNVTATAFVGYGTIPIGGIILWYGDTNTIPGGWVLCNGTTNNNLTTPDLRNRFVVGAGAGSQYAVGNTGGLDTVTLTTNQIPSHTHNYTQGDRQTFGGHGVYDNMWVGTGATLATTSAGGGQAHENRPPYYALCYIMRVK